MGDIFIQPETCEPDELAAAALAVYPHRLQSEDLSSIVEWAAGTQTPIFCHERDIPALEGQGFGAYRFHGISGYKEVGFQGGALEFYPARRQKRGWWANLVTEFMEAFRFLSAPTYHVLLRPRNEGSVLYLTSTSLDSVEWRVLTKSRPTLIIGSATVSNEAWDAFSQRFGVKVVKESESSRVETHSLQKSGAEKGGETSWSAKIGLPA